MESCPFYRQCQYSLVNLTMDPLLEGPPAYFYCRGGFGKHCLRQMFHQRCRERHAVPLNFPDPGEAFPHHLQ
jgi:hypothetical protein